MPRYSPLFKAKVLSVAEELGAVVAAERFKVSLSSVHNWKNKPAMNEDIKSAVPTIPSGPMDTVKSTSNINLLARILRLEARIDQLQVMILTMKGGER